jgi:hypothetical protein
MAKQTTIKIRRSSVQNKVPTTTDLDLGELAINTYDGKLFLKKSVGGTESIVTLEKQLTAGTGVSISSGAINIGQDVSTTVSPTFAGASLNGVTSIVESGTGAQNTLTVAGAGTGSLFAVGVSDSANDGINLKSLTSDLANPAKLTLSGSSVILKAGTKQLTFNSSGNIVLPANGDILDSNNVSVLHFPTVKQVTFDNPITDLSTLIYTTATATSSSNNQITVNDTTGFNVGDPVTFYGDITIGQLGFGGISFYKILYIKTVVDSNNLVLTDTKNGTNEFNLTTDSGSMIICSMAISSYQVNRAPRLWTNYDSLTTTGYDFSSLTFGDTYYDDTTQHLFLYIDYGRGVPEPFDITPSAPVPLS